MKVSVITPTTGNPHLASCIESVRSQTYHNVEHIIVVDGQERWEKVDPILRALEFPKSSFKENVLVLPYPTGTNRYNGHRIYGGVTYFADGDFHLWLDEDNELEPNHVENLVKLVQEKNLDWAYSFRKIIDTDGRFICNDDCESLGMWKSILNDNFVDVNCFFVKKELAVQISPLWYQKARPENGMEVDRAISTVLMHKNNKLKYDTTREYSVKYRVGGNDLSVKAEFFLQGNEQMKKIYPNGILPWK